MPKQEWSKYRKERKKDLRLLLHKTEASLERHLARVAKLEIEAARLQKELDTVDEKCDKALDNHYTLEREHGKFRVGQKVAEAILSREVAHVVGLTSGLTSVSYSTGKLKYNPKYWADNWFLTLLKRIDLQQAGITRQDMYAQFSKLKDAQSREEISQELGMFLLKVL